MCRLPRRSRPLQQCAGCACPAAVTMRWCPCHCAPWPSPQILHLLPILPPPPDPLPSCPPCRHASLRSAVLHSTPGGWGKLTACMHACAPSAGAVCAERPCWPPLHCVALHIEARSELWLDPHCDLSAHRCPPSELHTLAGIVLPCMRGGREDASTGCYLVPPYVLHLEDRRVRMPGASALSKHQWWSSKSQIQAET